MGQQASAAVDACRRHRLVYGSQHVFDLLSMLPTELALHVLSFMKAPDLCRLACVCKVWNVLVNDEVLWHNLCQQDWTHTCVWEDPPNIKMNVKGHTGRASWRDTYIVLWHGARITNQFPDDGVNFLVQSSVVPEEPASIAKLLKGARHIRPSAVGSYLRERPEVMAAFLALHDMKDLSLPKAARLLFKSVHIVRPSTAALRSLLLAFARQYQACNPQSHLSQDALYVLTYSMLILSADLHNPRVRNKMSKREFVRCGRSMPQATDELLGELYDDVWMYGHVCGDVEE